MNNRPPNRRQPGRRSSTSRQLSISPRDLSILQPALAENIRRFHIIHQSAVLQRLQEDELSGLFF